MCEPDFTVLVSQKKKKKSILTPLKTSLKVNIVENGM